MVVETRNNTKTKVGVSSAADKTATNTNHPGLSRSIPNRPEENEHKGTGQQLKKATRYREDEQRKRSKKNLPNQGTPDKPTNSTAQQWNGEGQQIEQQIERDNK
jgi:hypothetical protein